MLDLVELHGAELVAGFYVADAGAADLEQLFGGVLSSQGVLGVEAGALVFLREKIASKLEKSGLAPLKIERIRRFVPVERADRAGLFGESLPPGLILGD